MVDQAYAPSRPSPLGAQTARHLDVLVVDDDASVRLIAMEALSAEGYGVLEAHDGTSAIRMIARRHGRRRGARSRTARDQRARRSHERSRVQRPPHLDPEWPFGRGRLDPRIATRGRRLSRETLLAHGFAARVNTVLRRTRQAPVPTRLDFEGMRIDLAAHEVAVDGHAVELTPLEFELLACLARRTTNSHDAAPSSFSAFGNRPPSGRQQPQ